MPRLFKAKATDSVSRQIAEATVGQALFRLASHLAGYTLDRTRLIGSTTIPFSWNSRSGDPTRVPGRTCRRGQLEEHACIYHAQLGSVCAQVGFGTDCGVQRFGARVASAGRTPERLRDMRQAQSDVRQHGSPSRGSRREAVRCVCRLEQVHPRLGLGGRGSAAPATRNDPSIRPMYVSLSSSWKRMCRAVMAAFVMLHNISMACDGVFETMKEYSRTLASPKRVSISLID